MKNKTIKTIGVCIIVFILAVFFIAPSLPSAKVHAEIIQSQNIEQKAEDNNGTNPVSVKALSAAIAIGLAGLGGAIAMAFAISKSSESIARQPEAQSGIRGSLTLGLVFIETVVIYALIVAILIIFVL